MLEELGANLAQIAPRLPAGSPVLINGDWGSGKTTLLLAVQESLKDGQVPVVWFDAWRYEQEGSLLAALVRAVWKASGKRDEIKESFFNPLWRSALVVGMKFAPEIAGLAGLGILKPLFKILNPETLKAGLEAVPSLETLVPPEDETERLQARFNELLEAGWPQRPEEQRIVILVDDLDRCSPTGMVSLLEGIRLLLVGTGEAPCSVLVALDKTILAQAIAKHYAGISGFDSHRYLEKVFPIHFTVPAPAPGEVGSLVSQFLATDSSGDEQDALAAVLAEPMFANPRLMKRCINRFRLTVAFEARELSSSGSQDRAPSRDDRALARWIAAIEKWPALRDLLRRRDDAYWEKVAGALRDATSTLPDKEAAELLHEPGIRDWLRREMQGKDRRVTELRDADERLRRWGL